MRLRAAVVAAFAPLAVVGASAARAQGDPLAPLAIYDGEWAVRAEHPFSGASRGAVDHLTNRCRRFAAAYVCEQALEGEVVAVVVYVAADGQLRATTVAADGRPGGTSDLLIDGAHWTFLDARPTAAGERWYRVENFVVDAGHIRFESYESGDDGRTWTLVNAGEEEKIGRP